MIQVRQAQLADTKEILEIVNSLHLNIPEFIWNTDEFVVNQIANKEYFVAEDGGVIMGIISLRQRTKKISIETLAVKKEYQRRGVGSALIDFAKKFTQEKGFNVLHAYSFIQYHSTDFYVKRGFHKMNSLGYYKNNAYDCFELIL